MGQLDRATFGPHLRQLRQQAGLTQAVAARHAGVARETWHRWETGGLPFLPRAGNIARALQVPIAAVVEAPNGRVPIIDLYIDDETIAHIRRNGTPAIEQTTTDLANQTRHALTQATARPLPTREPPGPKPRQVAQEVRSRINAHHAAKAHG